MLTRIHIRDFALIDEVDVVLEAGLCVLTGETGAGKSIILDALALALGDRASGEAVREGAERADISATFAMHHLPEVRNWLIENHLDEGDDECLLRRVITRAGRSHGTINGRPAAMHMLKDIGERLIDIHGQHAHQSLLRPEVQRDRLDDYAQLGAARARLEQHYRNWRTLTEELSRKEEQKTTHGERMDLLRYQTAELEALALADGEVETLNHEQSLLAHAGQLNETCGRALATLYDNESGSVHAALSTTVQELSALRSVDTALVPILDFFDNALIQIQEGVAELRRHRDSLEIDPQRLAAVDQRLEEIQRLAHKHRIPATRLPALLIDLNTQLYGYEQAQQSADEVRERIREQEELYYAEAKLLSVHRCAAAEDLGKRVTAVLRQLGMPAAECAVTVTARGDAPPSPAGLDRVEFLVSANPGLTPKPLGQVASGGELSRISLGLQVVAAHSAGLPTLIFDEIDSGIGGAVAEVVGVQLRRLAAQHQVLCITHQAQLAAQAHHHLYVSKSSEGGRMRIAVRMLSTSERAEELARMLGGVEITASTRRHARELLERAQS